MLLPGTSAKLEPPEDCTFLDGERHLNSSGTFCREFLLCSHRHAEPLWAQRDCCVGSCGGWLLLMFLKCPGDGGALDVRVRHDM